MTPATQMKRSELLIFIESVLEPEPSVQGVLGIGSIATGHMQDDSDIDVAVFFSPMDWYITPAEFIWNPTDGSYHSIFSQDEELRREGIELDCRRLDYDEWSNPAFDWPEGRKAEFSMGWIAFDREGQLESLIRRKTAFPEDLRQGRLDEAVVWLDQHLAEGYPETRWENLGPAIAHDRLQAAYQQLVQGLFALNRSWMPWRNRQLDALAQLTWLPGSFERLILAASNSPNHEYDGYIKRVEALRTLFDELLKKLVDEGTYSTAPIDQAFIRSHDEPGYAWNMDEWRAENLARFMTMVIEDE